MSTSIDIPEGGVRLLVVRGPARDRLYERFTRLFASREDVRVIKERRRHERRAPGGRPPDGERRRGERRRRAPEWVVPPA